MTSFDFTTTTHGKWILAGEHAVTRGQPAIVFPLLSKTLTLSYRVSSDDPTAEFAGESGDDAHLLFWSVIEHGLKQINRRMDELKGHFHCHSSIPIGAGLGASGALCAAIARWFVWQGWISAEQNYPFARQLENLFHGNSSGIDILGALHEQPLLFQHQQPHELLEPKWQPQFALSFSGEIGITSHCIKKVETLWQQQPEFAAQIDDQMAKSVECALMSLNQSTPQQERLAGAMQLAYDCFLRWGLVGCTLEAHISKLESMGAIAAKPTGSGAGGYVLSLWQDAIPVDSDLTFIAA